MQHFRWLSTYRFECVPDLRKLPVESLTEPRLCDGVFKSIVVVFALNSGKVPPLPDVRLKAENFARSDKRRRTFLQFKTDAKNKRTILVYPDRILGPENHREE